MPYSCSRQLCKPSAFRLTTVITSIADSTGRLSYVLHSRAEAYLDLTVKCTYEKQATPGGGSKPNNTQTKTRVFNNR